MKRGVGRVVEPDVTTSVIVLVVTHVRLGVAGLTTGVGGHTRVRAGVQRRRERPQVVLVAGEIGITLDGAGSHDTVAPGRVLPEEGVGRAERSGAGDAAVVASDEGVGQCGRRPGPGPHCPAGVIGQRVVEENGTGRAIQFHRGRGDVARK